MKFVLKMKIITGLQPLPKNLNDRYIFEALFLRKNLHTWRHPKMLYRPTAIADPVREAKRLKTKF